jgi:hypothetical protein
VEHLEKYIKVIIFSKKLHLVEKKKTGEQFAAKIVKH